MRPTAPPQARPPTHLVQVRPLPHVEPLVAARVGEMGHLHAQLVLQAPAPSSQRGHGVATEVLEQRAGGCSSPGQGEEGSRTCTTRAPVSFCLRCRASTRRT